MRRTFLHRIVLSTVVLVFVNLRSFSQGGNITGIVTHDKEALQSATVSLGKLTVLTDQNGNFSLSVKPGNYTLIITHAGYKKIEQSVTIGTGETRNFNFNMEAIETLGDIVVLGSRSPVARSNLNTPVPVDAFTSGQLAKTGQTSLMQMLNFVAPSLRASLQIATEPVTLRGLDPDHTLILLNGTRYSNIAYINPGVPGGQLGRGSVGNDLNTIPFSAIEKVEILRDGASAQYGSDAIAGVIDLQLKESTNKTSVDFHLGQQYKGDGENIRLGVYHGIDLNKRGFLSYAGDLRYRAPTFRGGIFQGTVYKNYPMNATHADSVGTKLQDDSLIRARGFDLMAASNSGTTQLASFGFLVNGSYRIKGKTELFWTGAVNNLTVIFVNIYTLPKNIRSINTDLFPDGFKSRVNTNIWNASGIAGARGVTRNQIHWIYHSAYGVNTDRFNSENTNNASQQFNLGRNAPTTFYTGSQKYQQLTNTVQFRKDISHFGNKIKTVHLGWGGEWRLENFRTKAGEEASWTNYDTLLRKSGGAVLGQIVSPDDIVSESRNVICAYVEMETEINDRFLLNLASRFESFSDFGGNLAGKLAARYKLSDKFSLRGSASNGFRAPSMQQRYYSLITYGARRSSSGEVTGTRRGIFNNDDQVTQLFGVPSLEAEKSVNLSGGLTSAISRHIYLTIDAYWIQIKNRIVLSGPFDRLTNAEVDSILKDPSLKDYSYVEQVAFFANAINTKTHGVDIVIHGDWKIHKAQFIAIMAANFTQTNLYGDVKTAANLSATAENKNTLFSEEQRTDLESGPPRSKIILSLNYTKEKLGFMLRNTRFAKTVVYFTNGQQTFDPKILTDVSMNYAPTSWLAITIGANNIFDVYPDRIKNYSNTGEGRNIYALGGSPFGFLGGYYYATVSFNLAIEKSN